MAVSRFVATVKDSRVERSDIEPTSYQSAANSSLSYGERLEIGNVIAGMPQLTQFISAPEENGKTRQVEMMDKRASGSRVYLSHSCNTVASDWHVALTGDIKPQSSIEVIESAALARPA